MLRFLVELISKSVYAIITASPRYNLACSIFQTRDIEKPRTPRTHWPSLQWGTGSKFLPGTWRL